MGIGPKIVAGEATGEPAIRVFVRRKLPADQVPPEELIPPEIDGVTTDVAVGGDPIPLAGDPSTRPARSASSTPGPSRSRGPRRRPPRTRSATVPLTGGGQIGAVDSTCYAARSAACCGIRPNHDVGYALTNMHVVKPKDVTTHHQERQQGRPAPRQRQQQQVLQRRHRCVRRRRRVARTGTRRSSACLRARSGRPRSRTSASSPACTRSPGGRHGSQVQGRQAGPEHADHGRHDRRAPGHHRTSRTT